jgi:hypothetical protein
MVLPILIRSTEEGFRSVPTSYRLSAAALGLSRWGLVGPLRRRQRSSSRAAMWTVCRSRCSIPGEPCPSTSSTSR